MGDPWAQPAHKQAYFGHKYLNPTNVGQAHLPWQTNMYAQPPTHSPDSDLEQRKKFNPQAGE
jgi:hypothetical protein